MKNINLIIGILILGMSQSSYSQENNTFSKNKAPVIKKATDSENVHITFRLESLKDALESGGERAWSIIEKAMDDESGEWIRASAVIAAGELGGPKAWPIIERAMDDENIWVRYNAVIVAGKLGGEKAWPIIEKGVNDVDNSIREEAVIAAGRLGGETVKIKSVSAGLYEVTVTGKSGGERAWPLIEKAMDDKDRFVRKEAVYAAGKLGGEKAWPIIERGIHDGDLYVRLEAIATLKRLGGPKAWSLIKKAMATINDEKEESVALEILRVGLDLHKANLFLEGVRNLNEMKGN